MSALLLLAGVALFELKHFVADFLLQPGYVLMNKGRYFHPGGLLHAGIHMLGSGIVLTVLGLPAWLIALLVLGEGIVHYHVDWAKDRIQTGRDMNATEGRYWALFGLDQFLHQMTYVAMLWIAA